MVSVTPGAKLYPLEQAEHPLVKTQEVQLGTEQLFYAVVEHDKVCTLLLVVETRENPFKQVEQALLAEFNCPQLGKEAELIGLHTLVELG